ncbi:PE family protein [Mycobacterium marinum]|uniref:PE family protein n=1 Tax=Mycobacterium marinum TaxID=1781 RepID=UPI0021C26BEF|nr:PE family protein [Mycobacterium marinum]MDC8972696.1 PE family protein [Mycobacterium marinum]GJO35148.1 PE family immunomodulator PE5 [Mycobacterium marinum]GJP27409.1 PE family immunomodulator PE5 [Mycobacterium marinum]
MTLWVVPGALAAAGVSVEALSARLAAAHAGAASVITAVVPPAADPVSLSNAVGLSAHGVQHVGVATEGVEELARSGVGVGLAGASYAAGDAAAAVAYGGGLP